MIEPIQFVPTDEEGVDDHTGSESATLMYHYLQPKQQPKHMNHLLFRT